MPSTALRSVCSAIRTIFFDLDQGNPAPRQASRVALSAGACGLRDEKRPRIVNADIADCHISCPFGQRQSDEIPGGSARLACDFNRHVSLESEIEGGNFS